MRRAEKFRNILFDASYQFWMWFGLIGAILLFAACSKTTDGGPLGPTVSTTAKALITVTPASATIAKGDTINFAASGGKGAFTWSISDTTLAAIVSSTGVFTASSKAGTVTVTATDTNGATGTATITIGGKTITIVPSTAQVGKGATQTFTATGAKAPVFWSVDNATIGNIVVGTGVFTAGITVGTVKVSVLDADGDTATATVSVIANTITVTPVTATFAAAGSQAFTATGGSGSYSFVLSGQSGATLYTGATLASALAVGTVTFTQPTKAIAASTGPPVVVASGNGNQVLTVTVTDSFGDVGTATLNLTASTT